MLFQVGLGEAMKGVPFKNERELKIGLFNIEKFLLAQAIESNVREDVMDVIRMAFVDKRINLKVKSVYQPVISKNFNTLHFKMTLPVIREFEERVDASFKFIYTNRDEKVDTVLEKCMIIDKFGEMHSSRMDYELLLHDKSKNVTISMPVENMRIYVGGATVEFTFLCSNHKKITTSYKINSSKPAILMQIAVCQMTEAECDRMMDIVELLIKTIGSVVKSNNAVTVEESNVSVLNQNTAL